jgi:hypothetical protein
MMGERRRGRPSLGLERLSVRLPPEQLAYLDRRSDQEDRPMSTVLRRLIEAEMQRHPLIGEISDEELDRR